VVWLTEFSREICTLKKRSLAMATYAELFNHFVGLMEDDPTGISEFQTGLALLHEKLITSVREKELEELFWDIAEFNYELIKFNTERSKLAKTSWSQSIWSIHFSQKLSHIAETARVTLISVSRNIDEEEVFGKIIRDESRYFNFSDLIDLAYKSSQEIFFASVFEKSFWMAWQRALNEFLKTPEGKEISKKI
jgi:hypothetical protein